MVLQVCQGQANGFSSDFIAIEIRSPDCPDLTLIDLPGIVRTAVTGQSQGVIMEVRHSCEDVMQSAHSSNAEHANVGEEVRAWPWSLLKAGTPCVISIEYSKTTGHDHYRIKQCNAGVIVACYLYFAFVAFFVMI